VLLVKVEANDARRNTRKFGVTGIMDPAVRLRHFRFGLRNS